MPKDYLSSPHTTHLPTLVILSEPEQSKKFRSPAT